MDDFDAMFAPDDGIFGVRVTLSPSGSISSLLSRSPFVLSDSVFLVPDAIRVGTLSLSSELRTTFDPTLLSISRAPTFSEVVYAVIAGTGSLDEKGKLVKRYWLSVRLSMTRIEGSEKRESGAPHCSAS